ncbi:MAG: hypothetical protein KAR33_00980 [Candidatus Thorarchaeota archaeon]|nr:hypothetical protein [Candidatus Thorarchaeota archaeon]
MARKFLRFIPPIVFAIAGWVFASFVVLFVAREVQFISPAYDLIPLTPGTVAQDVGWLLGIVPLAGLIVYLILGIPISAIILFAVKLIRSTAYDVDIAQIGNRFSGIRMIRRATVPALFAMAISGIVMEFIEGFLFTALLTVPPEAFQLFQFFRPIIGTLITLPVVLAFFIPTWMLNDAGVVMHLKSDQLSIRRCPDSIGVGRWASNLLAGFTIFTIPFVLFVQHFLPIINGEVTGALAILNAFVFSIGIPFLAMAFVIPIIIFNEVVINGTKRGIRGIAKRFGSRELRLETVVTETKIVDKEPEYGWAFQSPQSDSDSGNI